jgi:hypothetical protein
VFSGEVSGAINFGDGTKKSAGARDVFLAEFDTAGKSKWSKLVGDALDQRASHVAIGQGIYWAFGNDGTVNLGQGDLAAGTQGKSIVLAKLAP